MRTNLKVLLSAVGVAALLASPAMAKSRTRHHHYAAPVTVYVPNDAYGSAGSKSDSWVATHSGSWDATHDPRENPQN
jgi:hypothetical protein